MSVGQFPDGLLGDAGGNNASFARFGCTTTRTANCPPMVAPELATTASCPELVDGYPRAYILTEADALALNSRVRQRAISTPPFE